MRIREAQKHMDQEKLEKYEMRERLPNSCCRAGAQLTGKVFKFSTPVIRERQGVYLYCCWRSGYSCSDSSWDSSDSSSLRNSEEESLCLWEKNIGLIWSLISLKFIWAPCAQLYSLAEFPTPYPGSWAHIRGRYWSAKIDDMSLSPLG
jgi:hypothetical protein